MKKIKYQTLLFALTSISFLTFQNVNAYDITLSLGNLCEYVGQIQTNTSGATNVCNFNPYLASSYDYTYNPQFILSPEIGLSLPKSGRDESISKMSISLLANAKYKFSNYHLLGGAGLFISRVSGSGGEQLLNNGDSTTSFPMPEETVYARNFIINLGVGMDFDKDWSADLHTYVFNIITSEDRAFSIAINGTYHFGEF